MATKLESVEGLRGPSRLLVLAALAHGAFWLLGGLWAQLSPRTFQAVTGPKTDYWLVRTVAGLLTVGGVVGLVAGVTNRVSALVALALAGGAGVLTAIDVTFVARGRISRVYLLDALAHTGLIASWAFAWTRRSS